MIELTCIRCPLGCRIAVEKDGEGGELKISGNQCRRGEEYAREEVTCPRRIVTCLLSIDHAQEPLSVKTDGGVPKEKVFEVLKEIKSVRLTAPVAIGTVILTNVLGTGVNVVATKTIEKDTSV